jgi:hypothetical protein
MRDPHAHWQDAGTGEGQQSFCLTHPSSPGCCRCKMSSNVSVVAHSATLCASCSACSLSSLGNFLTPPPCPPPGTPPCQSTATRSLASPMLCWR